MNRFIHTACIFFLLSPSTALLAQEEATEVDPKYTWDLTEIYPTLEAWEQARDEVLASFEEIEARRGTLGDSANDLYETLLPAPVTQWADCAPYSWPFLQPQARTTKPQRTPRDNCASSV